MIGLLVTLFVIGLVIACIGPLAILGVILLAALLAGVAADAAGADATWTAIGVFAAIGALVLIVKAAQGGAFAIPELERWRARRRCRRQGAQPVKAGHPAANGG